jgi:Translation initiation factor eIF3 subunit 135
MEEHNAELEEATIYLVTTLVKRFAKEFMYIVLEADAEADANDRQVSKLSSISLPEEMHRCGINMRYLGVLCGHLYDLGPKAANCVRLVLVEATSRCMKNTLNRDLRSKMRQLRLPLDVPYRQLVVDYLNLVFGSSQRTYDYWNKEMSEQMVNYLSFDPQHLASDPLNPSSSASLQSRVFFEPDSKQAVEFNGRYLIVTRLQAITGVSLTRHCLAEMRGGRNILYMKGEPFAMLDLEAVRERVCVLCVVWCVCVCVCVCMCMCMCVCVCVCVCGIGVRYSCLFVHCDLLLPYLSLSLSLSLSLPLSTYPSPGETYEHCGQCRGFVLPT